MGGVQLISSDHFVDTQTRINKNSSGIFNQSSTEMVVYTKLYSMYKYVIED